MNHANLSNILVEDEQISGTAILNPLGRRIGAIKRLYREAASGRIVFADASVGCFLAVWICFA